MFQIRKPTLSDLPLLTDIARKSFLESHGHSASPIDIENYMAGKFTEAALETELLDERNIFHLICHDGRPAGYSKIILDVPSENIPERFCCMKQSYLGSADFAKSFSKYSAYKKYIKF